TGESARSAPVAALRCRCWPPGVRRFGWTCHPFLFFMSGAWRASAWLLASDASIGAGRRLSKWKKRAGTMSFTHAGACAHESAPAPALCVARVRGRGTLRLLHPGGEQPVHHPERAQPPCTDAGRKDRKSVV